MAIWIKKSPDAEPVWMAADNRIRELALSIERRAGIAPDADGLRQIREWATEIVCQCDRTGVEERAAGCVPAGQQGVNKNRKETELPGKMRIGSLKENDKRRIDC